MQDIPGYTLVHTVVHDKYSPASWVSRKLRPKSKAIPRIALRACLHACGGPQVGEVTRLAVVEKWLAFTCKLTTPGTWGDVTRRCYLVARHVNREHGGQSMHFGGQCSFPLIICSRCNISVPWLFTVIFDEFGALWRACKCNMNSTAAWRVTPP